MSQGAYPGSLRPAQVAERLAAAADTPHHEFWPDEFSVLDSTRLDHDWLLRSRQVNDGYLLAMAVRRGGVFVTLDRGMDLALVRGATARHLVVI